MKGRHTLILAVVLLCCSAGCRRSPATKAGASSEENKPHEETILDEAITAPKDRAHKAADALESAQKREREQAAQLRDGGE